jgi:ATP-dependent RNA helicase DDX3X
MMEGVSSRPSGGFGGGDFGGGGFGGGSRGGAFGRGESEEAVFGSATTAGINFDKYDDIPISVSAATPDGVVPPPIDKFEDAKMPQFLRDNIERCRFTRPTPVQKHSIGIVQGNSDLMACAQTGSGKTGAFLIPAITNIVEHGKKSAPQPPGGYQRGRTAVPQCVVMAPTRELVEQIHNDAKKFVYKSPVQAVSVFGGEGTMGPQLRELERGCDLLIATPGRLHDLIERGRIDMGDVFTLILDEADRMLDMGFEPQIRRIVEQTNMPRCEEGRQTLMFSATFPPAIQHLAQDFLRDHTFLTVGRVGSTTDNITQRFEFMEQGDKPHVLMDIITAKGNEDAAKQSDSKNLTLIFVETKRDADILEDELTHQGFQATSIHGDRSQPERQEALRSFKAGRTPYLVATDVASRGLDIPDVSHVINFDCPSDFDSYVHRIGRTGRAGRTGTATAFLTSRDGRIASQLVTLLQEANQEIPDELHRMAAASGGRSFGGGGGGRSGSWKDARGHAPTQSWGGGGGGGGWRDEREAPSRGNNMSAAGSSKLMTTGGNNMTDYMMQAASKAPAPAKAAAPAAPVDSWEDDAAGGGGDWWDEE